MLRRARLMAGLCVVSTLSLMSAAAADTLVLQPVGLGAVSGLSDNGRVAAVVTTDNYEPFRWTAREGLVRLGRDTWGPLGHASGVPALSADGSVVAATILSDDGTYSTAGRWTRAGGWQMLDQPLPVGGGMSDGEDASVFGMSGDGAVVTGLFWRPGASGGYAHGFAWSAPTAMVDMGSSGNSSRIDGANRDGSVLVGWDEHPQYGTRRAAVWVNGVRTVLDSSDWPSEASATNADGTIIVGQAADPANAFQEAAVMWKWDGAQWVVSVLGSLNGAHSVDIAYAEGLSDDGSIVVGSSRPNASKPKSAGFIWTAATGLVDANNYVAANGGPSNKLVPIIDFAAITPDGRTIAAVTQAAVAPFGTRSMLIHRRPSP